MSGRYSLPDGIGVPYYVPVSDTESDLHIQVGGRFYGFIREVKLGGRRCEYTPLAPVGGYYEPVAIRNIRLSRRRWPRWPTISGTKT